MSANSVPVPTRAGELKHRLAFQSRAVDANGDATGPLETRFRQRAKLTWLRGSEPVVAKRLEGIQPVAARIRRTGQAMAVTSAWRAIETNTGPDRVFEILSVEPSEDNIWLDLLCEVRHGEQG